MSPHAVPPSPTEYSPTPTSDDIVHSIMSLDNTHLHEKHFPSSHLRRHDDEDIQDLICIGFGPASLAIAVALHDALEDPQNNLKTDAPKVRFLERQPRFAWHAGMLLPGAKMQITFIKDMATLRNPRSQFTFLNYLHEQGRLVDFTNLGTFLPQRIEYEDYMKWCAGWFDEVVDYGHTVESVRAGPRKASTGAISYFTVTSHDQFSNQTRTYKARHVVIAAGGKPYIPESLPAYHPRIIHSSQYATSIDRLFDPRAPPKTIAVIGAGQSAAEVFNNLPSRFPNAKIRLIIRGSALRPSDDSPFVNEIFNPSRVDDFFAQEASVRTTALAQDKATNYAVVRLELLEHIYSILYGYKIQYASEQEWPQRILNYREIVGAIERGDGRGVRLKLLNHAGKFTRGQTSSAEEILDADLVVVASGYRRDAHQEMLADIAHLNPHKTSVPPAQTKWTVGRDYRVQLAHGQVDDNAGIWLQGCNEATHGLSDTLLSILAVRGGEMVQSIFGSTPLQQKAASNDLHERR